MARSRKRNSNQEVKRFVKLDKNLTQSIAYKKLSGSESKIFHILLSQYNGSNNGKLAIPYNQAGEYELSRQTLSNSLNLLEAKGFIQCTRRGRFGLISLYAVTCFPVDKCFNQCGMKAHSAKATDSASNEWGKFDKWLKIKITENGGKTGKPFFQSLNDELLQGFLKG
ncbi:hypothetical protein [Aggregatibacter actinomycetemcomitans]|uniref:hypothetical protein n=1 Tax=Aggregatibacter actinomycetemcomitans TaxID=714 RepID=UPI00022ABB79|nr:hypothetical protein [Aggregatibacter actinomycetemcomitans]KOE65879.1 hypothetical protein A160_0204370 [Aggregatibacter actinomycetemcomitans serotype e str. A160]KOE66626.1 hypothetical protein SCC393_0304730 [Aggregatibacter actinomycetemcomitans serotype e str. SCC393]KYK76587.1 hypothetical protein SA2876_06780 [Aggregatibacter actinomycetemcomitans serotype e str. SA2876]TYA48643.1 hypothetical protein FXB74_08740 [Aggregatibacter actinomycetemcomitans]